MADSVVVGILDCSSERKFDEWNSLCDEKCNDDFESQDAIEPQWLVRVQVDRQAMVCHDIRSLVHYLQLKNMEPFTRRKFTQKQEDALSAIYVRKFLENENRRVDPPQLNVDAESRLSVNQLREQMDLPPVEGGGDTMDIATTARVRRPGAFTDLARDDLSRAVIYPPDFKRYDYRQDTMPSVIECQRLARSVRFPVTENMEQTGRRVCVLYQQAKRMFMAHLADFGLHPVRTWPFFWFVFLRISARKMHAALDAGNLAAEIEPTLAEMQGCFAAAQAHPEQIETLVDYDHWREEDQDQLHMLEEWQENDPVSGRVRLNITHR